MDPPARDPSALSFGAELDAAAADNERAVATGALAFWLAGVPALLLLHWSYPQLARFGRASTLTWLMLALLVTALWYGASLLCLKRGVGRRIWPWATPLFEATLPTVVMVIELETTPRASFVTYMSLGPLLYVVACLLAVLRLRWQVSIMVGLTGAVQFAVLLGFWLLPGMRAEGEPLALLVPVQFFLRPAFVFLLGIVGALIVRRLRLTMGVAHGTLRQRELFGKYRLVVRVASGGMGEVYRALYCPEGGFRREVAVKRIHPHLATDPQFLDAFRREAELCSRLVHPNIVQVFDFGAVDESYFLAMEYVEGATLADVLKTCREQGLALPLGVVAEIGCQILSALVFSHTEARDELGRRLCVIHRDLSPNNVLVSRAGVVKVTDFGVAKALGDKEVTVTTALAGKLSYMAPEQLQAQPLDPRCDLFAVGVGLWEAVCQSRLFRASSEAETIARVLTLPIPAPSTLRADLPDGWDAFLTRALERDKDARFQTAREMRTALEELRRQAPEEGLAGWVSRATDSSAKDRTLTKRPAEPQAETLLEPRQ